MHLDGQAPTATVPDTTHAQAMDRVQTDGIRNGVNGSMVNGTDLHDPPAKVTGIIQDPDEEVEVSTCRRRPRGRAASVFGIRSQPFWFSVGIRIDPERGPISREFVWLVFV